ncbi:MAG: nucleotide exchange factor GrpE [Desulfobulbaceae bacterium]|nr:nucleotide exchange factor GrpE [Desulfobulbaceae bacterium]
MVRNKEKAGHDNMPMTEEQTVKDDATIVAEELPDTANNGQESSSATASLEAEKNDLQDKLLRIAADFENYKKRMIRERESSFKYAEEALLKELLPSIDNLERALAHQDTVDETNALRQGIDLTLKALLAATAKFGLTAIDSVGQPFDPNLHEALAMEASADVPPQTVLREFEKGYYYKDRLLRAAKVVVAKSCE